MTREKLIDFGEMFLEVNTDSKNSNTYQFIDAAVKLFKQEPCEDAISRQDVWFKLTNGAYTGETIEQFIDRIAKEIENTLPVIPIRKKGKWCKQTDGYSNWYECSECGYGDEGEMECISEYDVRTNYCPNCGAEMVDSQESEE